MTPHAAGRSAADDEPPGPAMRRDIASAYLASASRIGSWVVVSALVYRRLGTDAFAMLALVRGTIGLLNYASLGLAPAFIHRAAGLREKPAPPALSPLAVLYANALAITFWTALAGILASAAYAGVFEHLYRVPWELRGDMWRVVLPLGVGVILRLASDTPGGVLQVSGRISFDNGLVAIGDVVWMLLTALAISAGGDPASRLIDVGQLYALTGMIPLFARLYVAQRRTGLTRMRGAGVTRAIAGPLLAYGLLVVAAQLADYLYSPTDYILIDRLLSPFDLASYAPAVQIDSGLLLLVGGLSAVLLPRAAIAHAGGSTSTVRRYYLRGTFASFVLLTAVSLVIWLAAPWIFRLWLGNPMPATQSILPLVLASTVLGGSSAVGRSILLAVGKARAFTVSVLIAGVVNVACSIAFVRYGHLGLNGIILGTVVAVVGRCVLWMPWYVMRTLRTIGPK